MHEVLLKKLDAEYSEPIHYFLSSDNLTIDFNEFLGQNIKIENTGEKYCIRCGSRTKKLYGEGFCYKCFITAPEADACVIHPEKCQAHLGISRDMEWSKTHCLIEHYVYLAITDHLKVGVTRSTQVPKRWIDQGALKAIKLAQTPYRQLAGLIEVDLKQYFSDKTYWKKMLEITSPPDIDLIEVKRYAASLLKPEYKKYLELDNTIYSFKYPLLSIPEKIVSTNLDKIQQIEGKLVGIKGQYLILDTGQVINIRKHSGFLVKISS